MTSSWATGRGDGLVPGAELGAHRHLVVSERLRARRRELGLTQKEVVARLRGMDVVTTNKALSALEHGAGLDVAKLPELARALECTLTWLVGLTDRCEQWEPDAAAWPVRSEGASRSALAPAEPAVGPRVRVGPSTGPRILGPVDYGGSGRLTSGSSPGSA